MPSPNLEIGELRMSYQGSAVSGPRAELISRRALEIFQEMVETDLSGVGRDYTIAHLVVPPIETSFDQSADGTIAEAVAEGIFRALLSEI
ncbi:MAG: hypothetical protein ACREA9_03160 [Pyrinomonadaceae bacterium]